VCRGSVSAQPGKSLILDAYRALTGRQALEPAERALDRGRGPARLFQVELEELYRVGTADLAPLLIADDPARVVPGCGIFHLLERIIRREIHLVFIEHVERAAQCRIVEIAARGDVEVIAEVVPEWPLAAILAARKAHARIDAPQAERDILTEVADADAQIREIIEQPGAAQPQGMNRCFHRKTPRRAHQPGVARIVLCLRGDLHARMQVEGHVELRYRRPEAAVLG